MSFQVNVQIDRMDMRADGGMNVFFKVRLGDYLVNVPMTLDQVQDMEPEAITSLAMARLHELALGLFSATRPDAVEAAL
jgi:hypothetical protein